MSVTQLCLTLCKPMCYILPGSSVHGNLQARTLVGCHFLLQGIFLTQGPDPGFLCCRQIPYHLSHQGHKSTHNTEDKVPLCLLPYCLRYFFVCGRRKFINFSIGSCLWKRVPYPPPQLPLAAIDRVTDNFNFPWNAARKPRGKMVN